MTTIFMAYPSLSMTGDPQMGSNAKPNIADRECWPTSADALVVARALRVEGDREVRRRRNRSSGPAVPLSI